MAVPLEDWLSVAGRDMDWYNALSEEQKAEVQASLANTTPFSLAQIKGSVLDTFGVDNPEEIANRISQQPERFEEFEQQNQQGEQQQQGPPGVTSAGIFDPNLSAPEAGQTGADPFSIIAQFLSPEDRERYGFTADGQFTGAPAGEQEEPLTPYGIVQSIFAIQPSSSAAQQITDRVQSMAEASVREIRNLQENLIVAGYLSTSEVRNPGAYDFQTAQALATMMFDANLRGVTPEVWLDRSLRLSGTLDAEHLKELEARKAERQAQTREERQAAREEKAERQRGIHRERLESRYRSVWGMDMPPDYLNDELLALNGDEFESFERSKEAWQTSGIAKAEMADRQQELLSVFSGENPQAAALRSRFEQLRGAS